MRVLFFAPRDCRPTNTGAKLRNFHLCRQLCESHEVTYLAFEDGAPENAEKMAQKVVLVPHQSKNSPLQLARGLAGRWPLTVLNYTTTAMQSKLINLLREQNFDAVQMESLLLAAYLPILQNANSRPKLICDWHNVDSEVLRRYADHAPNAARRVYALATAQRLADLERRAMADFDAHLTVSERDRAQLLNFSPDSPVFTVENGADTRGFAFPHSPQKAFRVVFVGSMDYHPNMDAAQFFAREIWPAVLQKQPDWVFTIVGRNPAPAVCALAQLPGVEVTGTVEDVAPFYAQALASVVPLRIGGGSRLKILESMAARVPVVSTTLGAEGLDVCDGKTCVLRDDSEQFGRALLDLARNHSWRQTLIEAAHELAVSRYDWTAIGARLRDIYEELAPDSANSSLEVAA